MNHLSSWRFAVRSVFLFLAAALPLAFYLRTYDSAMVKITLLQLGSLAAVAIWIIGSLEEGRFEFPARALPILGPAALLFLWNAIRFLFADYRWAALDGFLRQESFLLAIILTLLAFSKRDLRHSIIAICGGWLVVVLYGLLQRLGIDPFIWKGAFGSRVFSTLGNPIFLASYILICTPLPLVLALDENLPVWLRIVTGSVSVLGSVVLAWTGATMEAALFALSMAIFILLACRFFQGMRRKIAVGLALVCAAACLFVSVRNNIFAGGLKDHSRFLSETWKGTAAMIEKSPWIGTGPGSFWVRYPAFRRPGVILLEHKHNTETDHAENEFLEQWSDGGIVGLLLWTWLFGMLIYRGWKTLRDRAGSENSSYTLGVFAAVAGSLPAMLIDVSSRFIMPGWLIYFIAGLLGVSCLKDSDGDAVAALPMTFGISMRRALFVPVLGATAWLAWQSALIFQSDVHHNMAIYWSKKAQWDKALPEYDQEVPASPIYIMGQYFKGNVYQDSKDLERAVAQYRHVRTLAPHYVCVHYQEATALRKLGRKQEALEQLEMETTIDPVWDKPWHDLSELYRETGQPEKAALAAQREEAVKKQWGDSHGIL